MASFTLHYASKSKAERITWLLEELNLSHTTRVYSPKDLSTPFLEVHCSDGQPLTVAGYDNIVQYLIEEHDAKLRQPSWFI